VPNDTSNLKLSFQQLADWNSSGFINRYDFGSASVTTIGRSYS